MSSRSNGATANSLVEMQALRVCLDQLGDQANAQGMPLVANLIGAASRAIADEILDRSARQQVDVKPGAHLFDA